MFAIIIYNEDGTRQFYLKKKSDGTFSVTKNLDNACKFTKEDAEAVVKWIEQNAPLKAEVADETGTGSSRGG